MAARKRKAEAKGPDELEVGELVERILDDERIVYFPVRHFSPACAFHVDALIRALRPAAVFVEGPDDATPLIEHIVDDETRPPFTIFSSYVDRDDRYGMAGVLSPSPDVPARFRGWWPFVDYAPEYAALRAGRDVGAKLAFIDAPLPATIAHHHVPRRESARVVEDRHLAENGYFEALRRAQRRRSFDEFWNANFEVCALGRDARSFMRSVLTFAACARRTGDDPAALEADGTVLREAHMRHHIDAFLKEHKGDPGAKAVVVTGAFHSVALPFLKGQKVKLGADKNLETMLTGHSFQALAGLYHLNRLPGYGQAVWEAIRAGSPEPFHAAAVQLLIEIMRHARAAREGVSTADAVGAYRVARNLAALRGNRETTLEDLSDAVQMTYVKGDRRVRGGEVERATREVLVGGRLGRVTGAAGKAPLLRDFYAACKAHKLDVTGTHKVVRCDLGKQEGHRLKSAFLHQCTFLEVPMFERVSDNEWDAPVPHFKGPDLATGRHLELLAETWGVRWGVSVDARLVELADRGATVAQAAGSLVRESLIKARGDAAQTTRLLLTIVQMMLLDAFDEALLAVEDAVVADAVFDHLVKAMHDLVALLSYRDLVAPASRPRVMAAIAALFNKACLQLPMLANTPAEGSREALDGLQTLVRLALTFEGQVLDRELLADKLAEVAANLEGAPAIRGAALGVLFALGRAGERRVAAELDAYLLGGPERVRQAGPFLEGLFLVSKSVFLSSKRLLHAIGHVLGELDWGTFKALLPDLRRAFTQFIPSEIDHISNRVGEEVGLAEPPPRDAPIPAAVARVAAAADEKVRGALAAWL
ncbi:MAG: DUF5682 family protein [Polyangiaceae bacterium]|nr:DUF5682 family protein [Polyangiaceae bacterium]